MICSENDIAIQIKPIGNFTGIVYAFEHKDTCTFDDFNNQVGMPSKFTGGKVKIIPNEDVACGNTSINIIVSCQNKCHGKMPRRGPKTGQ